MKKFLVIILVIIFSVSFLYAGTKNLVQNYRNFSEAFKKKKFNTAAKYISTQDIEMFREIDKINTENEFEEEPFTIEEELANMWDLHYNKNIKNERVHNLEQIETRDLPMMFDSLKKMKEKGAPEKEIKNLEDSINELRNETKKEILFSTAKIDAFGSVIEKTIRGDYAMLACQTKYSFSKKYVKRARKLFLEEEGVDPKIMKYRHFKGNTLILPAVYTFVKEDGRWKLMLFSRSKFPNELFEDFINEYEIDKNEIRVEEETAEEDLDVEVIEDTVEMTEEQISSPQN